MKTWALIDGENIVNVVVGGDEEFFANHEDYKTLTLVDVSDLEEKPSPTGWTYKEGSFVKDAMPDPIPPVVEEEVEVAPPLAEPVAGLNPDN